MTSKLNLAQSIPEAWLADVRQSIRAHVGFGVLVLAYVVIALGIAAACGDVSLISVSLYGSLFAGSAISVAMLFLASRASYIFLFVRPDQLTKAIFRDFSSGFLSRRRLCNAAPTIILLSIFNSVFTSLKAIIPIIHPYNWDVTLTKVDRALHFGYLPWQLLQHLFGYPVVTASINVMYNLWFFVLVSCWLWQAFSDRDHRLRTQFFLTFMFCFILLGNLVATLAASGGPCYYGRIVTRPDQYEPLMRYLHEASQRVPFVWCIGVQDMLWKDYTANSLNIGSGISAMPSMHVAGATLFALLGWRSDRRLGIALTAYLIIILVGSVHLGWHYAVDGYVSIFCTVVIWSAVGTVLKKFHGHGLWLKVSGAPQTATRAA